MDFPNHFETAPFSVPIRISLQFEHSQIRGSAGTSTGTAERKLFLCNMQTHEQMVIQKETEFLCSCSGSILRQTQQNGAAAPGSPMDVLL